MKAIRALTLSVIFVLAIPAVSYAYQISVKQTPGKLRFAAIDEGSIYQRAGLKRNDVIREINGKKVDDTTPISEVEKVVLKGGRMKVERNGKIINMKLKPMPMETEVYDIPAPASSESP